MWYGFLINILAVTNGGGGRYQQRVVRVWPQAEGLDYRAEVGPAGAKVNVAGAVYI